MTNPQQESGGLPTAAIVDNPNSPEYEHCLKIPVASKEMSENVLEWGDELVRRSDVKALIQDKIEEAKKRKEHSTDTKNEECHSYRQKAFEELLEELKK